MKSFRELIFISIEDSLLIVLQISLDVPPSYKHIKHKGETDRKADRQRQINIHTERRTDRYTDRMTGGKTDKQAEIQTDKGKCKTDQQTRGMKREKGE